MGVAVGETWIYTLQFADDQVVVTNDKDDLAEATEGI